MSLRCEPASKLPPLIFGDKHAVVEKGFYGLVDKFSHLTPGCDYDSHDKRGFICKGNVLMVDGIVINQTFYTHMVAVSAVKDHNILIPLAGTHHGLWRDSKLFARHDQGFFIPANDRFQIENSIGELTGSLIITYDLNRLNRVIQAMSGTDQLWVSGDNVRHLPLACGQVHFKKLLLGLLSQIDAYGGDAHLLQLSGFGDAFYRLLAMMVLPDVFVMPSVSPKDLRVARQTGLMARFEQYIDAHVEEPITLTELEAFLGIGARALQYACNKQHGCTPREFIRNRKLDLAFDTLRQASTEIKLSSLAFELGFSSHSQFSKFFRQRFGVSPSQV